MPPFEKAGVSQHVPVDPYPNTKYYSPKIRGEIAVIGRPIQLR